jgi:thioredoxin reductase (NADPH)
MFENKRWLIYLSVTVVVVGLGSSSFLGSCQKNPTMELDQLVGAKNLVPVVIIGSGPAGLAAGVYTARAGLHTVMIEGQKPGGLLTETSYVENWPGEEKILGRDLMAKFKQQNQKLGVQFLTDTVTSVDFSSWPYQVQTADGLELQALSVIVATGATPRGLGLPSESKYWSKGVSACAVCDAPFFKGKKVVVVGGGDSALEQVLQLAPHVQQVTLLVRKDHLRASKSMQDKVGVIKNAQIKFNTKIVEILGDSEQVTAVKLQTGSEQVTMPIDGVFLAIGHDPASQLFQGQLKMSDGGYLELQAGSQRTSCPGVFAAGEVSDHVYRQAGVAAGEGIRAALDAINFLQDIGFNAEAAKRSRRDFFEVLPETDYQLPTLTTIDQFEKLVLQSSRPVVLDFYTDYCASCLHMLPYYKAVAAQMQEQISCFKVNADEADELVRKLDVLRVPTLLVYQGGQLRERVQEVLSKSEMQELFGKYLE